MSSYKIWLLFFLLFKPNIFPLCARPHLDCSITSIQNSSQHIEDFSKYVFFYIYSTALGGEFLLYEQKNCTLVFARKKVVVNVCFDLKY